MISLILLAGLIALFMAHRNTVTRLRLLEQQIDYLHQQRREPDPLPPHAIEEAAPRPWAPPPPPEPEPGPAEPETAPTPVRETLAILLERFVAGRLLIWVGGISLAVAGVFLVRYSIEIGLVTPPVRMLIAGGFGLLLVAAGEAARARSAAGDPRIAQALVGAGIFVLYAAVYGSLALYGLIGLGTAALLMGLVTAAALGLSLRHGVPTAVMGLTGGFLTPLLVGDPEASPVPLLAYLALLNAALFALAQKRGWGWLAAAAVALSFLWTAILLIEPDADDALAGGVFIVALGIAASLARPGDGRPLRLMQPAAIGLVQLALLVGRQDLGLAAWALFGVLAAACLFLSTRRSEFRLLPPLALTLALILLAVEAQMRPEPLALAVAATITLLFSGFAMPLALRTGDLAWTAMAAAALALPAIILRTLDPGLMPAAAWAATMIVLAIGPGWLGWTQRGLASEERPSLSLLASAGATALLLALALNDLLPTRMLPAAWLLLALSAALPARRLGDLALKQLAFAVAAIAVAAAILLAPALWQTLLASLAGEPALVTDLPAPGRAIVVLLLPGALLLMLAHLLDTLRREQRAALAIAAMALLLAGLYVPAKQIFGLADEAGFVARGLAERTFITQALFVTGWLLARSGRGGLAATGLALTMLAALRFVWFELVVHNPALASQWVGGVPVFNLLLPAYLGAAAWFHAWRRRGGEASAWWLGLFLAALIAGVILMVRQAFQGGLLNGPDIPRGEFYCYSLAGLLLSIGLLLAGIRLPDKALRAAGLALLTATMLKVFLIDAAELEGVLRIVSFLGLGVALIGVGKLYTKVLNAEAPG
ncbi:MAG TPA: DUF2339 domain-containing protein [Reyranella sp.]|nr:DUF2339 domain-containing protein [Reyranella sp.]